MIRIKDIWDIEKGNWKTTPQLKTILKHCHKVEENLDLLIFAVPLDWVCILRRGPKLKEGDWVAVPGDPESVGSVVEVRSDETLINLFHIDSDNILVRYSPEATIWQRNMELLRIRVLSEKDKWIAFQPKTPVTELPFDPVEWQWAPPRKSRTGENRKLSSLTVKATYRLLRPKEALQREFGVKTGDMLWAYARGIDHREVKCVQERKSIGAEVNWGVRFTKEEDAHTFLSNLAEEVCGRLSSAQLKGRTFTLKVKKRKPGAPEPMKFMGCGICDNISKSTTLGIGTDNAEVVLRVIRQLFKSLNLDPVEVRGLGLQVTKLMPSKGSSAALPFSADPSKKAAEGLQFTSEESPVPSKDFKDAGAAKHLEAHEPSKPPLRTVQDFFTMKRREDEKSLTSTDATKAKSESGMREGVNCVTLPEKWTTLSRGVEHLSMGSGRFNELSNADSMALGGSIVNAQDDCLQVQGGGSLGCNTKQPREDSAHQVQSINEAMGYGMEEMVMDEAEVLKEECTTITEEHAIGNNRPGLKSSDHRYPEGEDSACRMGNIRAHARPLENLAQVQYTDEAGAGGESRAEDMVAGKGKSLKGNRRTAMEEDVTDCLGEKVGNHSCREENEPDSEQRVGAWRVHAKAPESLPGAAGNQQERTGYPMVIPQAGNLMRPKGLEDLSIISGEPQLSRGAQMQQEIDQKEAQTEVMPRDEERREGDKPYRSCVDEAVKRNTHSGKAAVEEQRAQHLDRATQSCSPRHFTGDCTREAEAGGTSGFRRETHDDGSWQAPAVQQDGGVVTPASAGRGSSWLPPISQLDKSVLADLPPDLIAEIEQEYDRSRTTGSRSSAAHERTMAEKEHTIGAAAELERKTHPSVEGMSISQVDIGILKELPDMLQQEIVDNLSSHRGRDTGEETAAKRLQTDDQHGSRNGVDAHKDDGMGGPLDPAGQDAQERGQERIDALPPASQVLLLDAELVSFSPCNPKY
ncbi:hypothetical protein CBR_g29916 [Chara braunii]|uniref:DNA repair protein REV1 n=1 Tax=Chara braunii TaxID=69332 RepID=A0A388JWY9_CHABU|nr:hypothetical protein CBR_g29916 [Chara braunii]|eukprot:GBG62309.1 hypothetical protein CBR_g29916 [Chara braunii]